MIVRGKESAVVQIEMVVDHCAAVVLTLSLSGGSIARELHPADGHPFSGFGHGPLVCKVYPAVAVSVHIDEALKERVDPLEPGVGFGS